MARPKSNGPYAPLSANYFRDDAIMAAGEQAELLFVRCLAFNASSDSDGYITEMQMQRIVGVGMRHVSARCARLVDVGLLSCLDEAYLVRSWDKWNKSTEEIGKHLKRDRERKQREKGANSVRNPDGIQTDSSPQITTNQVTTNQININVAETRADVSQLCHYLAEWIEKNGSKKPTITKAWEDQARLLIDVDGREVPAAMRLIKWCQEDSFWKGNVLSMAGFRKKYDQLRLAANKQIADRKVTPTERTLDILAMGARMDAADQKELTR